MTDSSDALAELLTLVLTVNEFGTRVYRNSQGLWHRVHGPAVEWADGTRRWYLNGNIHRTDGPAIERADGHKCWCLNDQIHRTDGPAIERANGDKSWYQYDQLHRIDGPAVEYASGTKEWWLNGQRLSEKEFHDRLK